MAILAAVLPLNLALVSMAHQAGQRHWLDVEVEAAEKTLLLTATC